MSQKLADYRSLVFDLVAQIPLGKVATYKQLASLVGLQNARGVGRILHHNDDPRRFPCHRVVKSDGHVADGYAFGERFGQIVKLRSEGVHVLGGKINLAEYLHDFNKNTKTKSTLKTQKEVEKRSTKIG